MTIQSIQSIKAQRETLKQSLKDIDRNQFEGKMFGQESEYTYKGLLTGINSLLTDVSTLIKAPTVFLKMSTFDERNAISNSILSVNTYLSNPNQLALEINALKQQVRPFHVRYSQNRFQEFDTEIDDIVKRKVEIDDLCREITDLCKDCQTEKQNIEDEKTSSEELLEKFNIKYAELEETYGATISSYENLSKMVTKSQEYLGKIEDTRDEILDLHSAAKSHEEIIKSFSNNVEVKSDKLDSIDKKTTEYMGKLDSFEEERVKVLEKAKKLIGSAKEALGYKTAEGLSASFDTQYKAAKLSPFGWWVFGALLFLALALGLGVWIVKTNPEKVGLIFSRITLLPLPLIGAIFCANQYTKQKNIIEDYAYKKVLAQSIVGFSEQLKGNGSQSKEYIQYIETVLGEIHNDPLRKRKAEVISQNKDNSSKLDLVSITESIEAIQKQLQKIAVTS